MFKKTFSLSNKNTFRLKGVFVYKYLNHIYVVLIFQILTH